MPEETIKRTADAIKKLDLTDRFQRGMPGEHTVSAALELQIIPNSGWGWGSTVTAELYTKKWEGEVMAQRRNGDLRFSNQYNQFTDECIDVKNVAWVSVDSLEGFREDGWFFFNAWYRPSAEDFKLGRRSCIHFMVRACKEFKDYVRENVQKTKRSAGGSFGYEISFSDMRPEWLNNSFDPDAYSKLMRGIWDLSDYWKLEEDARNRRATSNGYTTDQAQ